jgi:valyl-tRNA synthetase
MINILTDNGCLNEHAGKFSGMKRFDVRQILELEMKSLGIYRGVEKNPMVLSLCSRSKDVIEPLIRQ